MSAEKPRRRIIDRTIDALESVEGKPTLDRLSDIVREQFGAELPDKTRLEGLLLPSTNLLRDQIRGNSPVSGLKLPDVGKRTHRRVADLDHNTVARWNNAVLYGISAGVETVGDARKADRAELGERNLSTQRLGPGRARFLKTAFEKESK